MSHEPLAQPMISSCFDACSAPVDTPMRIRGVNKPLAMHILGSDTGFTALRTAAACMLLCGAHLTALLQWRQHSFQSCIRWGKRLRALLLTCCAPGREMPLGAEGLGRSSGLGRLGTWGKLGALILGASALGASLFGAAGEGYPQNVCK